MTRQSNVAVVKKNYYKKIPVTIGLPSAMFKAMAHPNEKLGYQNYLPEEKLWMDTTW